MAYQAIKLRSLSDQRMIDVHNEWNGIDLNQAQMLHFHGSRGSQAVINIMKEICNKLGIQT